MKKIIKTVLFILLFQSMTAYFAFMSVAASNSQQIYKIVFLGDSLTEGLGVARTNAYPQLVEKKFHASGFKNIKIINSGVSGSTTASIPSRLPWVIQAKPQMVFLALGANDGLRGLSVVEMSKNLEAGIQVLKKNGIEVVLAGMKMPPNYGASYTAQFEKTFNEVAHKHKVRFFPFLLEGVAADKMNQPDGIHPNEKGYNVMAEKIYLFLKPIVLKNLKS